jgi:hypothetical protein
VAHASRKSAHGADRHTVQVLPTHIDLYCVHAAGDGAASRPVSHAVVPFSRGVPVLEPWPAPLKRRVPNRARAAAVPSASMPRVPVAAAPTRSCRRGAGEYGRRLDKCKTMMPALDAKRAASEKRNGRPPGARSGLVHPGAAVPCVQPCSASESGTWLAANANCAAIRAGRLAARRRPLQFHGPAARTVGISSSIRDANRFSLPSPPPAAPTRAFPNCTFTPASPSTAVVPPCALVRHVQLHFCLCRTTGALPAHCPASCTPAHTTVGAGVQSSLSNDLSHGPLEPYDRRSSTAIDLFGYPMTQRPPWHPLPPPTPRLPRSPTTSSSRALSRRRSMMSAHSQTASVS